MTQHWRPPHYLFLLNSLATNPQTRAQASVCSPGVRFLISASETQKPVRAPEVRVFSHSGGSSEAYTQPGVPDPRHDHEGSRRVSGCLHARPYLTTSSPWAPRPFRHAVGCPASRLEATVPGSTPDSLLHLAVPCHGHGGGVSKHWTPGRRPLTNTLRHLLHCTR